MPSVEEKNSVAEKLDDTLQDFKNLAITEQPKHIGDPSSSSQSITIVRKRSQSCTIFTIPDTEQVPSTSSSRFRPYALPKISRNASNTAGNSSTLKPRPKIVINDGDPLDDRVPESPDDELTNKHSFKKFKSCSQEAASPVKQQELDDNSNELNCAIDELAEYFEHFVGVNPKMSALAESMYA